MHGMRYGIMSTGSGLVEVLVTAVLLSLGLLGASILHVTVLRARHEATLASRAVQLAAGIAERLRANHAVMAAADADNPYLALDYQAADDAPHPASAGAGPACFGSASCSPAQLAQFDLDEWRSQLHAALPGARLRICRDLLAWDAAAHGVAWACSGAAGAPVVIKLGWRTRHPEGRAAAQDYGANLPRLVWQVAGGAA